MARGASGSSRGVLVAAVLPELELDRAAVGAPEADNSRQRAVRKLELVGGRFSHGSRSNQRPTRPDGFHVQPRSGLQKNWMIHSAFLLRDKSTPEPSIREHTRCAE